VGRVSLAAVSIHVAKRPWKAGLDVHLASHVSIAAPYDSSVVRTCSVVLVS